LFATADLSATLARGRSVENARRFSASAQAVEHYEITRYGTLISWAGELGLDEAVEILWETLDEEEEADRTLSVLGESRINASAMNE
jgi:ferritin-like metal-binding protein YciE